MFDSNNLVVHLQDGRILAVPLAWFPKLVTASPEALAVFELISHGLGIRWPELNESLSVCGLLWRERIPDAPKRISPEDMDIGKPFRVLASQPT